MPLPEHGRSKDEILDELEALKANDVDWESGRCFSYVFSAGEKVREVARAATALYLSENALNTSAFPSLGKLQSDVVHIVSELVHGGAGAAGFMTSGGTESILCIVKAARERGKRERSISAPEMVVPESAHAAFHKGAHYFGVKAITVPVGDDYRADVDAMAAAVTDRTVLIVGSAPQYPQGVIDPIPEMAALAAEVGASFHTDACMGGMVLPFLERLGREVPGWDFRVDGVTSVSVDLHKLGYTPKGASVVLHRTKELRRDQTFSFDGWLGGLYASSGMAGTKPGGPIAAAWAVLNFLGKDGYARLTRTTVEAADRFVAGVRAIEGLRVLGEPAAHVAALAADGTDGVDVFALGDALQQRGWFLDRQGPPDSLHATVSAGNAPMIDAFLDDLGECAALARLTRAADRGTEYATLE
jgi:sphinganine-1-phosphate aldolase